MSFMGEMDRIGICLSKGNILTKAKIMVVDSEVACSNYQDFLVFPRKILWSPSQIGCSIWYECILASYGAVIFFLYIKIYLNIWKNEMYMIQSNSLVGLLVLLYNFTA